MRACACVLVRACVRGARACESLLVSAVVFVCVCVRARAHAHCAAWLQPCVRVRARIVRSEATARVHCMRCREQRMQQHWLQREQLMQQHWLQREQLMQQHWLQREQLMQQHWCSAPLEWPQLPVEWTRMVGSEVRVWVWAYACA